MQHLRAAHTALVFDAVQRELHVEIFVDESTKLGAESGHVLVAHLLAGAQVLAEAVAVEVGDGDASTQRAVASERAADRRLEVELAVVPNRHRGVAIDLGRQPARDVFDRTADGVLAVERALWTAQNFDALNVEHVEQGTLRARDVDVVEIEPDTRINTPQRVGLADAANEHRERRA